MICIKINADIPISNVIFFFHVYLYKPMLFICILGIHICSFKGYSDSYHTFANYYLLLHVHDFHNWSFLTNYHQNI